MVNVSLPPSVFTDTAAAPSVAAVSLTVNWSPPLPMTMSMDSMVTSEPALLKKWIASPPEPIALPVNVPLDSSEVTPSAVAELSRTLTVSVPAPPAT